MKRSINQSTLALLLNGISILALVFLIYSLFSYSSIHGQLNTENEERIALTYQANRFMNGSAYLTNEVRAFAATGRQKHYDNYWKEVNELKNRDKGIAAMQKIGITQGEQEMIDQMSAISNRLVPLEDEAMKHVMAGNRKEAIDYVYGDDYSGSIEQINVIKEQFLKALEKRTTNQVADLKEKADFIKIEMMAALFMVGIMQAVVMGVTKRRILRPVIAVRDQMGEISQGNLSAEFALQPNTSEIGMLVNSIHETKHELKKYIHDIDEKLAKMAQGTMDVDIGTDYRGEFLPIQNAMRQILDAFNHALWNINRAAERISEEAKRMASGAQVLSSGTVMQASAVQELSANIQDISAQVERTSADADHARACAQEAGRQLQLCDGKMASLADAMEDILNASDKIGGIVKTIEEICMQTNILALNAAVEAARAGEAGKGFAVVADQVQELANKSSESAQDIAELVGGSMKLVKYGVTLTAETTSALSAVVAGSKNSEEIVSHIADSAQHQAQTLKQLTQGMEQISGVVQTNAETAKESAESARELSGQAEELKVSVHKFKLRRR